jgi:ferredoxin-NADP reductase
MAPFQTLGARLVRSVSLSDYTKHLEFEVHGSLRFGFVPGQWVSVKATMPEGQEITRAYSIASPPEGIRFAFCLNRVQDGFMSNHLCDMPEGAQITFQGPFGDFILRPPARDTIMIATGTGIAPFRAMLHWLFDPSHDGPPRHEGHQIWLIFGVRYEHDLYYDAEFKKLAKDHSNFHYMPTLSRGDASWTGARNYVQDHVKEIAGTRTNMHAYICGLDRMVSANRDLLKGLGWDRKSIRYEKYD